MKFIILVLTFTTVNASSFFTIKQNECIRQKENFVKELKQCQKEVADGIYALTNIPCADNKAIDLPFYLNTKRKKCVDIELLTNKMQSNINTDKYDESCEYTLYKSNQFIRKSLQNCKDIKEEYSALATTKFCSVGTSLNWYSTAQTSSPLSQIARGPQCFVCGEDHFRTKEMAKCTKCPSGYIATGDKNDHCTLCTETMFNNNECYRPSTEFCAFNYKLANTDKYTTNPIACRICDEPGTFTKHMNQNIECDKCPEGYIYNGYNCIPCPVGSFQYNNVCIECPMKTFNDKIGNNMCYPITDECPVDSRANFPGATHCDSETYIEKAQRLWYITIVMMILVYTLSYTGL